MGKKLSIALLIVGSLLIIFICILLFVKPTPWPGLDLSATGQIGDTIGGIAAPIVGILGAVLVYLSFKEQLEANRIQKTALNKEVERSNNAKDMDIFLKLYDNLDKSFQNISLNEKTGSEAVSLYLQSFKDAYKRGGLDISSFIAQLDHVLIQHMILTRRVLNQEIPPSEDELTKQMIWHFYRFQLHNCVMNIKALDSQIQQKKVYKEVIDLFNDLSKDMILRKYQI